MWPKKENVDEDILLLGKGPLAVELDIMQPINPEKSPKVIFCSDAIRLVGSRTSVESHWLVD